MRTLRVKIYKFDELSESAKKTAIEWYKTLLNEDPDILFFFKDDCAELAKENGFTDIKLSYSLSWSQGDGLSFSGEIDKEAIIKEAIPDIKQSVLKVLAENCEYRVSGNDGRYCFASKGDIDFWLENGKRMKYLNIQGLVDRVLVYLENKYMDLCKEMEKNGYAEIEYCYTDESIIENIRANDYEFYESGNKYTAK